jgi:hypothetical protein
MNTKMERISKAMALMPELEKFLKLYKLSISKTENVQRNIGITPVLALAIMIVEISEQEVK